MTKIVGAVVWTLSAIFLLLAALCPCSVQAQQHITWRAGVGINPSLASHIVSFKALPGIAQPPAASAFASPSVDAVLGLSAFAEVPVFSWLSLGVLADIRPSVPAALTASEFLLVRDSRDSLVSVEIQHRIDARLRYAGVGVFAHIALPGNLGVRIVPKVDILTGSSFTQTQEIVNADIEFIGQDGGRVLIADGSIPDATPVLFSLSGALTYPVALSKTFTLQFEGGVQAGLSSVVSGLDWTTTSVQSGVSLVFNSSAEKPVLRDTVWQRDTTTRLVAGLVENRVRLADSSSTMQQSETPEATVVTITRSERYVLEMPRPVPLLTTGLAIRFVLDDDSEAAEVNGDVRTVETVRHVLVAGQMLYDGAVTDNPLFGMFTREFSKEQFDALGFTARAMQAAVYPTLIADTAFSAAVVSYADEQTAQQAAQRTQQVWSAATGQSVVVTVARATGNNTANSVAVITTGITVPEPVVVRDTAVLLPMKRVLLYPEAVSEAGVQHWSIVLRQRGRELYRQEGQSEIPVSLSWIPDARSVVAQDGPVQCIFTVEDRSGQRQEAVGEILFKRSQERFSGKPDTTIVQFVVHGREVDAKVVEYVRAQLRRYNAVPEAMVYWYTSASSAETPELNPRTARAIGLRTAPTIRRIIIPDVRPQVRRANDITEIIARVKP